MANALKACGWNALLRDNLEVAEVLLTQGLVVASARVLPLHRAGIVAGLMAGRCDGGDPDGALALFEREWPALDRHLPRDCHERDVLIAWRDDITAGSTTARQEEPPPDATPGTAQ